MKPLPVFHSSFFLILLCLISNLAVSQEKWSLEKCVNYALENNIQIKQQALMTEVDQNNLFQSRMNFLPTLNGNISQAWSSGRALDQTTYQFTQDQRVSSINTSLNSNLTLFNGMQRYYSMRQSHFNLLASLQQLEKLKNDISLNVAAGYLQILLNIELLEAAKQQLEGTRLQVERTSKLVEAGSLPVGNLLEIQAQEALEELQLTNAQNQLDISYLTLSQLLELDSVSGFQIEVPVFQDLGFTDILSTVPEIYADAEKNLPQIRIAEYQLSGAEAGLNAARGGRSPRLYASASYGTGYSSIREKLSGMDSMNIPIGTTAGGELVFSDMGIPIYVNYPMTSQFRDNASTTFVVGLSFPLFNNWQVNNSISNSRLNVLNSKYNLDLSKNLLYKDIQQAHADALASLKRFQSSEKSLNAQKESFKYTSQKYEVGLITTVDYNLAKTQLAKTESDLLQAKYNYLFTINILNFYRGLPLKIK